MSFFSQTIIDHVWAKATPDQNNDPNIWRKDLAGAWIRKDMYGTDSKYGWEIDHIMPVSRGGQNNMSNLQPLHWENNRRKSDSYPTFTTCISSSGNQNINIDKSWIIRE